MAVNVNTNVAAMTAQRYLNNATNDLNNSMERLSSGTKINSAKDDAAGLQISNRLTAQTRGKLVQTQAKLFLLNCHLYVLTTTAWAVSVLFLKTEKQLSGTLKRVKTT
jgi:hypothetical protein